MEHEFVPKKTITVQLPVGLYEKLEAIVRNTGQTKTKLMEKLIAKEYSEMGGKTSESEGTV